VSVAAYTAIHNPVQALRQLINNEIRPDLIFLDINMPFMNGMEVLAEIKKREFLKKIPIIIFSTSIPMDIKNKIKDLGPIEYYTKPNDFTALKNLLKGLL
jgi:CheY-like chemotaxis protein